MTTAFSAPFRSEQDEVNTFILLAIAWQHFNSFLPVVLALITLNACRLPMASSTCLARPGVEPSIPQDSGLPNQRQAPPMKAVGGSISPDGASLAYQRKPRYLHTTEKLDVADALSRVMAKKYSLYFISLRIASCPTLSDTLTVTGLRGGTRFSGKVHQSLVVLFALKVIQGTCQRTWS